MRSGKKSSRGGSVAQSDRLSKHCGQFARSVGLGAALNYSRRMAMPAPSALHRPGERRLRVGSGRSLHVGGGSEQNKRPLMRKWEVVAPS